MKYYYQPELTEEFLDENPDFHTFSVFRSKKLAEKVFPDSKILIYKDDDIENPTYVDNEYPLHQIDVEGLEEILTAELGFKLCIYTKVKKGFNCERAELSSTNLVTQTGIFKNVFEYTEIGNHGGGVIDTDTIWFNLHIYYKHIKGGTNGVKLGDAYYNTKDKTWKVKFVSED